MNPRLRTHNTPWGIYRSGGSAGSFSAHTLYIEEGPREPSTPGYGLQLAHRRDRSAGSTGFGNALSHTLDVRVFEIEPDMLENCTGKGNAELREGVFPSPYGVVPDCKWQMSVPLSGGGLVTVSLCPESECARL